MKNLFIYLHATYWLTFNFHRFTFFLDCLSTGITTRFAYDLTKNLEGRFDD